MSHSARSHASGADVSRIATGHLPGGADAIVVVCNDRDVHGAAALRCCAQFSQHQGLKLGPVFGSLSIIVFFLAHEISPSV